MALDIDRYAHLNSPVHQWDPRFKMVSLFFLIIVIALLQTIPLALLALAVSILLLRLSAIPGSFVIGGIRWVILFLLPFFIIMPISYPGEADLHLLGIPFSWAGFRLATLIVLKASTIVLTSYAIFGTSSFAVSMNALQRLKCPSVFVQMLLFTYRYIFVFLDEMERMDTAMKARGFVKKMNMYTLNVLGNFVGTLLIRSFERTERIYKAMLSKGYKGEFHTFHRFQSTSSDYQKAGAACLFAVALIVIDHAGWFSNALQGWL